MDQLKFYSGYELKLRHALGMWVSGQRYMKEYRDDCIQEGMIKAYLICKNKKIDGSKNPSGYLFVAGKNAARDFSRKMARWNREAQIPKDDDEDIILETVDFDLYFLQNLE